MTTITKGDLVYSNYSWSAYQDDDPKVTGEPDSSLLNRKEGYEVLYFINKFIAKHSIVRKSSIVKIEMMLREVLPGDVRTQAGAFRWIKEHWEMYVIRDNENGGHMMIEY